MDKFVHSVIETLGLKIQSRCNEKSQRINLIMHTHPSHTAKTKWTMITEKARKIMFQNNLDRFNVQNMQLFMEKQTNVFDQCICSKSLPLLALQLKNINKQITQTVKRKSTRGSNIGQENNTFGLHKIKLSYKKSETKKTTDIRLHSVNRKKIGTSKLNLLHSVAQCLEKEIKLTETYLKLYTKHMDFIKEDISITLYVATKMELSRPHINTPESKHQKNVQMLCKQAVLCLIEPSEKADVWYDKNLCHTIKYHLSQGCEYHFDVPSDSLDYYSALLILSHWAKVLVRHPQTIMIRTICNILGCSACRILVLSCPEEMSN